MNAELEGPVGRHFPRLRPVGLRRFRIGGDYACEVSFKGLSCEGYRLPTEAEWEYAARSRERGPIYTGKLTILGTRHGPELDPIAWYGGNSGVRYEGGYDCSDWPEKQHSAERCGTHPVGGKAANEWQLRDMLGNVREWTWDWEGSYPPGKTADPLGPETGSNRVVRGGSWFNYARYCRSAYRSGDAPGARYASVGFRLVRTAP